MLTHKVLPERPSGNRFGAILGSRLSPHWSTSISVIVGHRSLSMPYSVYDTPWYIHYALLYIWPVLIHSSCLAPYMTPPYTHHAFLLHIRPTPWYAYYALFHIYDTPGTPTMPYSIHTTNWYIHYALLHMWHILLLIAYIFREIREFVFIIIVQFTLSANNRIRFVLKIVFVSLYITPSHYHHCANLSEGIELIKCLSDIFCRVCE